MLRLCSEYHGIQKPVQGQGSVLPAGKRDLRCWVGDRHHSQAAVNILVKFLAWRPYRRARCAILARNCHGSRSEEGNACDVNIPAHFLLTTPKADELGQN